MEVPEYIRKAFEGLKEGKKVFALMLFFTEFELGISNNPGKWVNTRNILYINGLDALEAYANTACPASQLIDATSPEELEGKIQEMRPNYQNQAWLDEHLYPAM